ncbi:MAG: dUTP diphosphatase [Candidatus Aminicenantaceae bacterium]
MKIKVERISKNAKLPFRHYKGDAGLDLYSSIDCVLKKGEVKAVQTGIKIAIPDGYVGLIWDKSGLSLNGVHRLAGVIDSGYRGEVKVVLANLGDQYFTVKSGMKIAQLLIQSVVEAEIEEIDKLNGTARGKNGFGSTGNY